MSILTGDTAKAVEALKNGQDVAQAVHGEGSTDPDSVISTDDIAINAADHNSALDAMLGGEESGESDLDSLSAEDSESSLDGDTDDGQDAEGVDSQTSGSIEEITVSDDRGRRKVKVDFNDREKLKKYVRQAHGMRKFQAERDHARKQLDESQSSLNEIKTRWDALEAAYQDNGIRGLVELLDGEKPDAYEQFERSILDRHELRRNASPEELELLDAREREAQRDRELEKIRRENEEFRKRMESEKEATELAALESTIHPVYEKYNFTGKLGDGDDEALFNDMLWNSALKKLEPLEEQGLEITREMVDRAFGDTANAIRKRIRVQADKRVKSAVSKKKQQAAEVAEKTVQKGIRSNDRAEEARGLIRDGNISGIFKNWGRYGQLFNK